MFNQTSGCHNYIIMHFLEFPIAFQFVYVVIIDLIILFANATNGICIVRTNMGCRKNCWPAATSEILILNCMYVIFHIPTIVSYVYIHNIYACSYSICKWSISIVWKCKQFHKLSLNYHLKQIWFLHLIQIKFIWCICCNKCEFKILIWIRIRIRFQIYVLIALWWS